MNLYSPSLGAPIVSVKTMPRNNALKKYFVASICAVTSHSHEQLPLTLLSSEYQTTDEEWDLLNDWDGLGGWSGGVKGEAGRAAGKQEPGSCGTASGEAEPAGINPV